MPSLPRKHEALLCSARPGDWAGKEELRLKALAKARASSIMVRRQAAQAAYADLLPTIKQLKAEGKSLAEIATALNNDGHATSRGLPFSSMQIHRILKPKASNA